MLRSKGVIVREDDADFSYAISKGRKEAQMDSNCHFVDDENSKVLFSGYVFDNELIVVNGLLTYVGLYITSSRSAEKISF